MNEQVDEAFLIQRAGPKNMFDELNDNELDSNRVGANVSYIHSNKQTSVIPSQLSSNRKQLKSRGYGMKIRPQRYSVGNMG